jgi:hypothetical protein
VQRLFSNPVRFNGRLVLVGDGIKIPKRGKQMRGVKLLRQHVRPRLLAQPPTACRGRCSFEPRPPVRWVPRELDKGSLQGHFHPC